MEKKKTFLGKGSNQVKVNNYFLQDTDEGAC